MKTRASFAAGVTTLILAAACASTARASGPTLDQVILYGWVDNSGNDHAALDPGAKFIGAMTTLLPFSIHHPVKMKDMYTGSSFKKHETFGWYYPVASGAPQLNPLNLNKGGRRGDFRPQSAFGLYLSYMGNKNHTTVTWYSEPQLNPDNPNTSYGSGPATGLPGDVHALLFKGTVGKNTYWVAFEDQFFSGDPRHQFSNPSDGQFEDMVLRVKGARLTPVPEPAFVQMGVLLGGSGILAGLAKLRRRKG